MDFGMYPPEINSGRMYAGPGPGPLLGAATAWDRLAAEFGSAAAAYEAVLAELGAEWTGPAATAMAAAAAPYVGWLRATAGQAEATATQGRAAVAAYEAAFTQTVPPPLIAANRSQRTALIAGNLLGQNTAAIAVIEAAYAAMWAQDALVMYGYAGAATAAATLTPFAPPPQTTNPAGSGDQAAAGSAASQAQHALSALPAQAVPLLDGLSSAAPAAGMDPTLAIAYASLATSLFGALVIDSAGSFGIDSAGSFGIDFIGLDVAALLAGPVANTMPAVFPTAGLVNVSAGLGQASPVGGLSVPPAWTVKAPPAVQYVSTTTALAAPELPDDEPGIPFAALATAGLAARALGGMGARPGRAAAKRARSTEPAPSTGRITQIGADLRELADLRAAGLLTDDEFAEEKRQLLGH